ncbi:MAG: aldo/keto reductase [Gammaproteobacteria bacterium]|nr:aldo/keto reductase [Gammaproteobacteria bacterium]
MQYRNFGTTGLEVSELVFGGGAVGGLLINADDDTKLAAIRRAMEAGINWIDTAPSYGDGKSEEALGWLLKEIDETPHISTKVSVDTSDFDLVGQVERSVQASLERLKQDKVTLLQLHNPIGTETKGRMIGIADVLKPHGVLDALEAMKAQHLTDHIGITALGDTASIIKVLKSNRLASAQVYFNLLNPSAAISVPPAWPCYNFTGIVDTCVEHGVAPMNIRVFSAGVIATDERHGRERPLTPGDTVESETAKAKAMFDKLADQYGSRAQTAVRFALAQPRLACVVIGLAELAYLDEAIEAHTMGPLDDEALATIDAVYRAGI